LLNKILLTQSVSRKPAKFYCFTCRIVIVPIAEFREECW